MEKKSTKILILLLIIIGFITTFASGFILSGLLSTEKKPPTAPATTPTITPIQSPNITDAPGITQDSTKFLPGKYYFDDTIYIVTKDKPRVTLIATAARAQQEVNYVQNTRVSYFDGTKWTRQSNNIITPNSTIVSNDLLNSWIIDIDPSRVLKQTVLGKITINNTSLNFSTNVLQNEIGIRSLPGYTKFMSSGTGTLIVNDVTRSVYVLYTRIYSLNAEEIQYYNQYFNLTTDWIAFWDTNGNFYHLDATKIDKPTRVYQTHQLGIMEGADGAVTKTFDLSVVRDSLSPPSQYTINMNDPVNVALNFNRIDGVNKAPDSSFIWYMGNIEGTVRKSNGINLQGIGLVEYIH